MVLPDALYILVAAPAPTRHPCFGRVSALLWKEGEESDLRVDWDYCSPIWAYTGPVVFILMDTWWSLCVPTTTKKPHCKWFLLFISPWSGRIFLFSVWVWSLLPLSGNIYKCITSIKKRMKVSLLDQEAAPALLTFPDATCLTASSPPAHSLCPLAIWDLISLLWHFHKGQLVRAAFW